MQGFFFKRDMSEKEILILQHVASEGPGLIGEVALSKGFTLRTIRLYKGESVPRPPRHFSALVVMGGPMGVYDEELYPYIGSELRLIEAAFKARVPVLGVCLGAQLMARAAGGKVFSKGKKEIGFYKLRLTPGAEQDRLLMGLPQEFVVFQWHGDTFNIPEKAVNLASSEDFEHQLLKVGDNSYGLQFHIEVTEAMVSEFLLEGEEELRGAPYIKPAEVILSEAPELLPSIHGLGRAIISRFLRQIT